MVFLQSLKIKIVLTLLIFFIKFRFNFWLKAIYSIFCNIPSSTLPHPSYSLFTEIFQTPILSFFHPTVLSTAFASYLPHFFDGVFILIHQERRGPSTARPELPPFHKAAAVLTERSGADLPNI